MKKKGKRKRLMTMLSKRRMKKRFEGNMMKKKVKRKRLKPVTKRRRTVRMMRKLKKKWWNLMLKAKMIKQRLKGKRIKKKKLKGKSLKPRKETPKDNHNEPQVETNRTDETPTPPRGNQTEGTPTPPRGRAKEMAARRLVTRPMEEEPGKGVEVVAEEAVETEGKNSKKTGEIVEEYIEEEKQRWIMVVYKEAPSPWIMHRCKENAAVAVPKKSDKPKRKSQWVQTPSTEGKKRKAKP
ncbi:hypothetical protein F2Q69_00012310 [Brassica cretica]|uniref:Uncharacterized protein n=1 Tax=Brassica cretica TaxID=69181 RepID=A0A8S9R0P0_BRACR|nr:hypothetical protein F2Q69_00012310 [Brassica cretica]